MIKAIFFDIHEVITHGDFAEAYKNFANQVGVSSELMASYHKENISGLLTGTTSSDHMLSTLGLDKKIDVQEMMKEWEAAILSVMTVDQQMITLLETLRNNYVLATLTNLTESRYLPDLSQDLYSYFDHQVLSFEEGLKKPDPAYFQRALKKTGFMPNEVIFVDDQIKNTEAAESLGIKSIQFFDYASFVSALVSQGVKV